MAIIRHPTLGGFHGSHEAGVVEWSSSALTRTDSSAVQSAVLLVVNRLCVGNGEVKANELAQGMHGLGCWDGEAEDDDFWGDVKK